MLYRSLEINHELQFSIFRKIKFRLILNKSNPRFLRIRGYEYLRSKSDCRCAIAGDKVRWILVAFTKLINEVQ